MYQTYEIYEMLKNAAMVVGESKTPDAVDYTDVLHSFMRLEKCVYHHSAKRHARRFPGMPYGVYPYSGRFGEGYIVSHKKGLAYYLLGGGCSNEKYFHSFR